MDKLPIWIQWLVSVSTVLSSVGVIIAFVQLKISGKQFNRQLKISTDQFHTQLKVTQDQFNLINQGFVRMTITVLWLIHSDELIVDPTQPIPLDASELYYGGRVKITLENVGNLPVKTNFRKFKAFVDGQEMYDLPVDAQILYKDTIHPKTHEEYTIPDFSFKNPETGLRLSDINLLNITYSLLIEYKDFNAADTGIKTIERDLVMIAGTVYNAHIHDKL